MPRKYFINSKAIFSAAILFLCGLTLGCVEKERYVAIYRLTPDGAQFYDEYAKLLPFYTDLIRDEEDIPESINDYGFMVDRYDLNDDGISEWIVSLPNHQTCGASQCTIDIYQISNDNITRSAGIFGTFNFYVLASVSHGYHDLAYHGWVDGKEIYSIWQYDGHTYKFLKHVRPDQVKMSIKKAMNPEK